MMGHIAELEIQMRRLIFLILVLGIGLVIVGFYQGWFSLVSTVTPDGKQGITVTVDKDKVKADEQAAKDKAKDLGQKVKDKTVETVNKVR